MAASTIRLRQSSASYRLQSISETTSGRDRDRDRGRERQSEGTADMMEIKILLRLQTKWIVNDGRRSADSNYGDR